CTLSDIFAGDKRVRCWNLSIGFLELPEDWPPELIFRALQDSTHCPLEGTIDLSAGKYLGARCSHAALHEMAVLIERAGVWAIATCTSIGEADRMHACDRALSDIARHG